MDNNARIIQWAAKYLLSHGYVINNNSPENIQTTPWSNVIRFLTTDGYIYLKQTPPALALESIISQILYDQFHASVPLVIATNKKLHCFLMKDSGKPLREIFKQNFQPDLLCQAIKKYTAIQSAVIEHINIFIDLGVPDWRLAKLPDLYIQLISHEDLLIEDGLTNNEIHILHELHSKFSAMCEHLSHYKIPETIDHCDFHDNNILIDEGTNNIAITDLGETVITHPFFSLITCLRNATYRYSIKETDKIYLELQNACFENFVGSELKNNLLKIFSLAKMLWPIYTTLGEYRLMLSSYQKKFKSLNRHGRLAIGFKEFIKIISSEKL